MITTDLRELGEFYKSWTGKSYNEQYDLVNAHCIITRDDNKIVGALVLVVMSDPFFNRRWGLLEDVYVIPEYRRKGVATRLMGEAESVAKSLGCGFVKLTSYKLEGQALYEALGYDIGKAYGKGL